MGRGNNAVQYVYLRRGIAAPHSNDITGALLVSFWIDSKTKRHVHRLQLPWLSSKLAPIAISVRLRTANLTAHLKWYSE